MRPCARRSTAPTTTARPRERTTTARSFAGSSSSARRRPSSSASRASPTWHPAVRTYVIHEAGGGPSAAFYVDVFPREEKQSGAWMQGLVSCVDFAADSGRGEERHVETLVASFTPPIGASVALLAHHEV